MSVVDQGRPGAELPEDLATAVLERWPVARLATLGPLGPHAVPVVFARAGGRLWSPVDGKPKSGAELARLRHVRADPRVCLLFDEYTEEWSALWWLRVPGLARVVEAADPAGDPEVAAAVAALLGKYPQYGAVPLLRDPPRLLCVEPRRLRSWCAGPEAVARLRARLSVQA